MQFSKELIEQLLDNNINPDDVVKLNSKYDKTLNKIITTITTKDNKKHTIYYETTWYASRKNKRW